VHSIPRTPHSLIITGFIRGILRGVRYAKSLRVLFLHRRSPSWTTLVLYSRAVFIFNEPTKCLYINLPPLKIRITNTTKPILIFDTLYDVHSAVQFLEGRS
jgi:hypothetical protein